MNPLDAPTGNLSYRLLDQGRWNIKEPVQGVTPGAPQPASPNLPAGYDPTKARVVEFTYQSVWQSEQIAAQVAIIKQDDSMVFADADDLAPGMIYSSAQDVKLAANKPLLDPTFQSTNGLAGDADFNGEGVLKVWEAGGNRPAGAWLQRKALAGTMTQTIINGSSRPQHPVVPTSGTVPKGGKIRIKGTIDPASGTMDKVIDFTWVAPRDMPYDAAWADFIGSWMETPNPHVYVRIVGITFDAPAVTATLQHDQGNTGFDQFQIWYEPPGFVPQSTGGTSGGASGSGTSGGGSNPQPQGPQPSMQDGFDSIVATIDIEEGIVGHSKPLLVYVVDGNKTANIVRMQSPLNPPSGTWQSKAEIRKAINDWLVTQNANDIGGQENYDGSTALKVGVASGRLLNVPFIKVDRTKWTRPGGATINVVDKLGGWGISVPSGSKFVVDIDYADPAHPFQVQQEFPLPDTVAHWADAMLYLEEQLNAIAAQQHDPQEWSIEVEGYDQMLLWSPPWTGQGPAPTGWASITFVSG